jgi:hypothetical protein
MVVPLHMGWRHVLFANWPAPPDVVAPHVPDALTVDTFDGQAWLSVVPFTNVDVRPTAVPSGWGLPLPELNLRTYVTAADGPGVYFFNLDAQGILGVVGARLFHHLPYYYARIDLETEGEAVQFTSRRLHPGARPARFRATYGPTGERFTADPDSRAAFLTERYRYYTEDQRGRIRYATIEHDPWPLFEATVDVRENTLFAANGFDEPASDPVHLYSPGVDTRASRSRLL